MQVYPFIHSDDETASPTDDLKIYCAADCPAQPVEWLWPGKIPIGKVTLLVGDPGTGKSLVALDIAARLSRACAWPDHKAATAGRANDIDEQRQGDKERGRQGVSNADQQTSLSPCLPVSPSPLPISPSSTLILSAEDDLADTIRPRLDAAGADPRRVFVIPAIADLRHDFAQLRAAVNRAPNCRLIIVDPINAYVGPADSHFQTIVRKVLAPLAELATEKRIAVLAIAHLRKNDGPAIHRAAGSMGFVAAARAVWTVCRDESNPGRSLLLPLKNNLSPTACGLAYSIQSNTSDNSPTIAWDSTPIAASSEQALAPAAKKRGPEAVELQDAGEWLRHALADGPQSASQLTQQATQIGFHERTLRRALRAIGGNAQKRGLLEGWWWSIPVAPEPVCETAPGGAGGCHAPFPNERDAATTFIKGTTDKRVPFPKTCPLPENINVPPVPYLAPKPPNISESIAFIDSRDRQNRRTGRFSDQFSQPSQHRHQKPKQKTKQRPTKTGNPILDRLLDALRQPLPNQTAESVTSSPDTS